MAVTNTSAMDPAPPLKPHERHTQLEVDVFCVECGYNLHGQPVTRDPNLGIFVCRCPECGKYHPAGTGITAVTPWLRRFASILLLFWVLIILFATFMICMGFGAITVNHIDDFSYRRPMTTDGREVEYKQINLLTGGSSYQPVLKGTTKPVYNVTMVYTLDPPPATEENQYNYNYHRQRAIERVLFGFFAAILGLVAGGLLVVFLWHWKKRRYLLVTLLPFGVAAFVMTILIFNDEFHPIRGWAVRIALGYAAWEAVWMCIGILIGRPIARTLLRMFVPPKPRQHFACLWRVDGKTMPVPAVV